MKQEKEYIIYCDESDKDGAFYCNFYGGLIVGASQLNRIVTKLEERKKELNLGAELKWSKVTKNYLEKYELLISTFFEEVLVGNIKVRVMFVRSAHQLSQELQEEDKDQQYLKLYYQFIKHAFGLKSIPKSNTITVNLKLFLDKFPFDSGEKINGFKNYVCSIPGIFGLEKELKILPQNVVQLESREHILLQCVDIITGSMQFRLNDKHLKQSSTGRRGKKTIAKEKLYKHIFHLIQKCTYQYFNIGESTKWNNGELSLWEDKYRHWDFKPNNSSRDPSKTKGASRRNEKGPTFPT